MDGWLAAALERLDRRLEAVCLAEEARAARLVGGGGPGWTGLRAMLAAPASALMYDEDGVVELLPEGPSPLRELAAALRLDETATSVVVLLLAAHVEPRYRAVLGVLQEASGPGWVSDRGLQAVLGRSVEGWARLRDALAPGEALVGGGIVRAPTTEATVDRPWELAPEVRHVLLGGSPATALPAIGARWEPLAADVPDEAPEVLLASLDADWEEQLRERYGQSARGLLVVPLPATEPILALRAGWRAATAAGGVLAAAIDGAAATDAEAIAAHATQLAGGKIVLLTRRRLPVAIPALAAGVPPWSARVAGWRASVAEAGGALALDAAERLASARRVPRATIEAVVRASPALTEEALARTADRLLDRDVPHGVRREVRHAMGDLVLRDTTRAGLERLLYFVQNRDRLGEDPVRERAWRLGHGPVVLFSGRSGTGKTLAAEAVAGALHRPLVVVDLSRLVSKYIGETEKHIDEVLGGAQRAGCVLFFDEADALFAQRTDVSSSNDRYANLEVGYLLQRIEQHDGVVILATNLRQSLDEAFLRRFQFRIEFPMPDEGERARIWTGLLAVAGADPATIDVDALAAAHRLSGGDIRNATLKALLLAQQAGVPLARAHVEQAIALELLEMGRLSRRDPSEVDRGTLLARLVSAIDDALRARLSALYLKELHVVHGAPTREALAGKRPAIAVSLYRMAGPRAGRDFRFGVILSAWSGRPEEEHELLGVVHQAVAGIPTLPLGEARATLRLQESADFDLLHRFWSSHGHPVRASVVVEGDVTG